MDIAWSTALPEGVTVDFERAILERLAELAQGAGLAIVREGRLDLETAAHTDLVLETESGRLLFEVRRKTTNTRARIDIDSRPKGTYRTRHVLLEKDGEGPWSVLNDSDLVEPIDIETAEGLKALATRMLAPR